MVKAAIIAVIAILFFSFVIVGAAERWGYSRYGAVYYYGEPFYQYFPIQYYPGPMYYPGFQYPDYSYPMDTTLSSRNMYRYGAPVLSYPVSVTAQGGRLCGLVGGQQFGCEFGMVCDYTKTNQSGIGVCSAQSNYPYYAYAPSYESPSKINYYYGTPPVAYPAYAQRSGEGKACGVVNGQLFGCDFGLVCDYYKSARKDTGVCSRQSTYPYFV